MYTHILCSRPLFPARRIGTHAYHLPTRPRRRATDFFFCCLPYVSVSFVSLFLFVSFYFYIFLGFFFLLKSFFFISLILLC